MSIASGQLLDQRYRIIGSIARGGMGTVYEAEDLRLGRRVAVKVLLEGLANDASCRERFRREAEAAARTTHPNLVALYDLALDATPAYLVMELLEGVTLEATLAREGRLPWRVAARIGMELSAALACLHGAGIVHRDIKPSNVLIETSGRAKLIDLGVAQLRTGRSYERLTQSGAIVGTPGYMAPEQLSGGTVTDRTDLWALGVLLYYVLSGQRPFAAADLSRLLFLIAHESPTPLHAVAPETPEPLAALVMSLLSKDPAQRPVSAAATQNTLSRCLDNPMPEVAPQGVAAQARWDLSVGAVEFRPTPSASATPPMGSPLASRRWAVVARSHSASAPARSRTRVAPHAEPTPPGRGGGSRGGARCSWPWASPASPCFSWRSARQAPLRPGSRRPPQRQRTPASQPMPSRLEIIHSGTDALETNRQLAPTLDPLLRACINLAERPLGVGITYAVYINVDGTPNRLELMYGAASPAEATCIERALMASRWPPRLSTRDPAMVILTPAY
jgi:serine/threonine protein kinase